MNLNFNDCKRVSVSHNSIQLAKLVAENWPNVIFPGHSVRMLGLTLLFNHQKSCSETEKASQTFCGLLYKIIVEFAAHNLI